MSPEIEASMSGTSAGQSSSKKARTDSLVTTHSKVASLTKANKITNATAIMGMQGLINHLTDILEQSMVVVEDKVIAGRHRAMEILQNEDTDLPLSIKVALMQLFSDQNYVAATDVYAQTVDKEMCYAFIESLLQ